MYGCSEFKQKSMIYEKLRYDYEGVKSHKNETDFRPKTSPETVIKNMSTPLKSNACCYNYRGNNHKSINCINTDKDFFVFV